MTTQHTIQTIIELIIIIAAIAALFNENKITNFEKRLFQKIKKIYNFWR